MSERNSNQSAASSAPQGKPKKRRSLPVRILRGLAFFAVAVILLVGLLVLLLPVILNEARVRHIVADQAAAKLHRAVSIESAKLELWSGHLVLGNLKIADREGFTAGDCVQVKNVDAVVEFWPLVSSFGRKVLLALTVTDPQVRIERNAAGQLNIEDLFHLGGGPMQFSELSVSVKASGGRVLLIDNSGGAHREAELRDLAVDASLPALDQPFTYQASGSLADGRFSVKGSPYLFRNGSVAFDAIHGQIVDATVNGLPAETVLAIFNLPPVIRTLDGTFSASADKPGQLVAAASFTGAGLAPGEKFQLILVLAQFFLCPLVAIVYDPGNFPVYGKGGLVAVVSFFDYVAAQKYLLFPVPECPATQFVAHAPSHDHLAGYICGNFKIIAGACRQFIKDQFFTRASAEKSGNFSEQLVLHFYIPVFRRKKHCITERHTAR